MHFAIARAPGDPTGLVCVTGMSGPIDTAGKIEAR
jgi:hypothetical protein